jgi:Domain of unknown function (DUF4276)
MAQVFVGLFVEGNTDSRFLHSIVQKTLETIAFDCSGQIDIIVFPIKIDKSNLGFTQQVLEASKRGMDEYGIHILCTHVDADAPTSLDAYTTKINPAKIELSDKDNIIFCKILAALVPIQETESWLLADKQLLKDEIGTTKSDNELGIHKMPENITNPKEIIENAIRLARENLTKKRRKDLVIGDLYLSIGQRLEVEKLEKLSSYIDFKNNIKDAFKELGLLK